MAKRLVPAGLHLGYAFGTPVIAAIYARTDPKKNVNWVFGPGEKPQTRLPPRLYLALEMLALPACVFLPMHVLLRRLFSPARARA